MALGSRLLYASANGDRWHLVRETETERVAVLHTPNTASGGRGSEIGIAEFLARGGGPEQQALLRLISGLVPDQVGAPEVVIGTYD